MTDYLWRGYASTKTPNYSIVQLFQYWLCGYIILVAGCSLPAEVSDAAKSDKLSIGIAWPENHGLFVAGARLAVTQANESGGIAGKHIELVVNEDEASQLDLLEHSSILTFGEAAKERSRIIARDFTSSSPRVVAVIGHQYSAMAFAAAHAYQQNRMLFIAPTATDTILTTMGFDLVFRMLPTNLILGAQLAKFAHFRGYHRVAVFNERSEGALELTDAFSQQASEQYGIKTVIQKSFFNSMPERDLTKFAVEFRRQHHRQAIDAILIFTNSELSLKIIKEFRKRGVSDVPFIGNDSLDQSTFWNALQAWQEQHKQSANVAIPTVFDPQHPQNIPFTQRFKHEYGKEPDRYAALAYDSINMLLHAIQHANGSNDSLKIADELRYGNICSGLTGNIYYQDNGDVRDKLYLIKWLDKKGFSYFTLENKNADQQPISKHPLCIDHDRDKDGVINPLDHSPDDTPEMLIFGVYQEGEQAGVPVDSDRDQVPDYRDQCRNDSPEAIVKGVDQTGCPVDHDHDEMPDYRDACPSDSKAALQYGVDQHGCPIDSDNDGVADYLDQSPHDTQQEISAGVDANGIPKDSDADGMPDYLDHCPLSSKQDIEAGLDSYGCAIDQDHDGVPNYWDQCPENNPEELKYGVNREGCPTDSDTDSVVDYLDQCRSNTKEELTFGVDAKGCPTDSDSDGVADYLDQCRTNTKEELSFGVDEKGCPTDSDTDGVADYLDQCRTNTKEELSFGVDAQGCPTDSDADGVADYLDQCRTNTKEELAFDVDAKGCPTDSDADGVADYLDQCRTNTKEELSFGVDAQGCPTDSDADGVADYRDQCRTNTKEELAFDVDAKGCPKDSDSDGVADYLDQCRTNTKEELSFGVDAQGCPTDSDADGVADYLDQCRTNTKEELSFGVDAQGCPTDSDADGVADYLDQCRTNTKEELSFGVDAQGCPTDSDADGVADYLDQCRTNTKEELAFGVDEKGCPTDSDADGVADYRDQCRTNTKEELAFGVDAKGCPTDSDADGVADYRDACRQTPAGLKVDKHGCVVLQTITFASDKSFAVGKALLSREAKRELRKMVKKLNIALIKSIHITAHTDSRGSEAFNQRLSEKRAQAVKKELQNLGIPGALIHAEGKGESVPIASNATEEGRARNRRVDIELEALAKKNKKSGG